MARGSIVKRGKNWAAVVSIQKDPDKGGRRSQIWRSASTKRAAEKLLSNLLAELDSGGYVKPSKDTVGTFLHRWLVDYISTQVRAKTFEGYQQRGKRLIAGWGHIPLVELRPEHIRHYYREKGKTLAPATLTKHHNLLKAALSQAVEDKTLPNNVADAVKPPRASRKEMRALTGSEVHSLLGACEDTLWHPMFHTLTWCGMRRSELLGLKWGDIDLLMATLQVRRSLHRLKGGIFIFEEPKTARGRRTIALSPASCLVLRAHRERQGKDAALLGLPLTDGTLVFGHADGSPRTPSTVTLAFRRLVQRLGLGHVRLHDLRHTMASLYLEQGVNPKTVAERLGHASVTITLDLYSHCLPGVQEAAAVQFDTAMESAKPTPGERPPAKLR